MTDKRERKLKLVRLRESAPCSNCGERCACPVCGQSAFPEGPCPGCEAGDRRQWEIDMLKEGRL